ncbi:MAG TPA: DMT family transporter [Bacteroidales bacterium]|nr:DMT family transporter [Bacteroidales bacterium]
MNSQNKAYIYAIATVLLWSTVATAFKIALKELDFFQLLNIASFTATIVLFVVILFQQKWKEVLKITPRAFLISVFLGLLNPFAYYLVLFKAYDILPAQEAQPLNYVWPLMLVLISIPLLKQKISVVSLLAIFISFFGVLVISTHGHVLQMKFSNLSGALLALGSSVIWAFFWVLNLKDKRDEVIKLFWSFLIGAVLSFAAVLIFSEPAFPATLSGLAAVYSGLFEMGITFLLWMKALKYSSTTAKVSNFIFASPFLSLLGIYFIVGEKILPSTITGLILIVAGIIIQQYSGVSAKTRKA